MLHPNTVNRLALRGLIGRKVGKRWRFKIDDLDRYMTNDTVAPAIGRGVTHESLQAGNP
jgi:hypothetical protein